MFRDFVACATNWGASCPWTRVQPMSAGLKMSRLCPARARNLDCSVGCPLDFGGCSVHWKRSLHVPLAMSMIVHSLSNVMPRLRAAGHWRKASTVHVASLARTSRFSWKECLMIADRNLESAIRGSYFRPPSLWRWLPPPSGPVGGNCGCDGGRGPGLCGGCVTCLACGTLALATSPGGGAGGPVVKT